jgi:transposase
VSARKPKDPIAEIAKRRKAEDAILRKQLAALDTQIETLKQQRELVASLLGVQQHAPPAMPLIDDAGVGMTSNGRIVCADCQSEVPGPNAKGECPACTAFPFEVMR